MATYKQYSSFNEQWCDVIPSHWDSLRLKRILQERKERNNPIKTDFLLSLTAKQGVVPHSEKEGVGGNKPKDDLTKYNIAHPGDLLVNCMNVVSGAAGVSSWSGAISPIYYALYPRTEDINIWYYHYIFRLKTFQRSLLGLGKGILMHNLNGPDAMVMEKALCFALKNAARSKSVDAYSANMKLNLFEQV